jgi:uncharacterized protein YecE (DUF72 family)
MTSPALVAASDDPVVRRLADDGLYLGITAWTQASLDGVLYPPTAKSAEERLRYYASRFPITEVDSTFYHPPADRTSESWVARTPPGFLFDVKAYRLLTQHPTPPAELWRDLRDALPPELAAKATIYARDLPPELLAEALRRFGTALEPMRASGRLGLVLFQLPRYVYPSRASFEYLDWVANQLEGIRVGIEFRQQRWMDDEHRQETIDFLTQHHLVYVCVDEPQGFASSVPPVAVATADIAEVRFHGRNAELWEARNISPAARHRYNYRRQELAEWVAKIKQLHDQGRPVHVLFNNCDGGFCVGNARTLARLLAGTRPGRGTPVPG